MCRFQFWHERHFPRMPRSKKWIKSTFSKGGKFKKRKISKLSDFNFFYQRSFAIQIRPSVVDVKNLFWRKSSFPKNLEIEKHLFDVRTCTKMWKQCYFNQNYAQKLFIAFKMAYSCCFGLRGNLDFRDFLQKKFYSINNWKLFDPKDRNLRQ